MEQKIATLTTLHPAVQVVLILAAAWIIVTIIRNVVT